MEARARLQPLDWTLVFGAIAAAAALCGAYLLSSPYVPLQFDELYHVFAARSWSENGTLAIADGTYRRGWLLTKLVGGLFYLSGSDSVLTARIIPIFAAAALLGSMFLWVGRRIGLVTACALAFLLIFNSWFLEASVFIRFYAPQAFLLWVATMATFALIDGPLRLASARPIIISAIALAIALHLQPTTLIGAAALAIWVTVEAWWSGWLVASLLRDRKRQVITALCIATLFAVGLFVALRFGGKFSQAPAWAAKNQFNPLYYLQMWWASMPLLVAGYPLAIVLAWQIDPRITRLAVIMTAVPIVVHSIAPMKAARYIAYTIPYFLLLWAIALGRLHGLLAQRLAKTDFRSAILAAGAICVTLVIGLADKAYRRNAHLYVQSAIAAVREPQSRETVADPPWDGQENRLRLLIRNAPIIVNGDDLRSLYHLGRHDVLINTSRLSDVEGGHDFVRDFRTGHVVLASADATSRLLRCTRAGIIIVPEERWRQPMHITAQVADRIEQSAAPVTPGIAGFHLFRWHGSGIGDDCPAVRGALGARSDAERSLD